MSSLASYPAEFVSKLQAATTASVSGEFQQILHNTPVAAGIALAVFVLAVLFLLLIAHSKKRRIKRLSREVIRWEFDLRTERDRAAGLSAQLNRSSQDLERAKSDVENLKLQLQEAVSTHQVELTGAAQAAAQEIQKIKRAHHEDLQLALRSSAHTPPAAPVRPAPAAVLEESSVNGEVSIGFDRLNTTMENIIDATSVEPEDFGDQQVVLATLASDAAAQLSDLRRKVRA